MRGRSLWWVKLLLAIGMVVGLWRYLATLLTEWQDPRVPLANLLVPGHGMNLPLPAADAASNLKTASLNLRDFVAHMFPKSFVEAMATNEVLQIVVFSLFFGFALGTLKDGVGKPVLAAIDGALKDADAEEDVSERLRIKIAQRFWQESFFESELGEGPQLLVIILRRKRHTAGDIDFRSVYRERQYDLPTPNQD